MEGYIINKLELKNRTQSNIKNYKYAFKHFIAVFGGDYDVREVTRGAISRLQQYLYSEGYEPGTNNLYIGCLSGAYNLLITDEIVDRNPFYNFDRLGVPEKKKDIDRDKLELLLDVTNKCKNENKKHLCRMAILLGIRRKEILNISDVDLEKGFFTTIVLKRRKKVMLTRPMNKEEVWHDFKYFMDKYGDREYPFKVCHPNTFTRWMRELQDQAGLKDARCLQAVRHTFVTQGFKNGCSTRDMFRYIGHASITTTEGYAHDHEVTVAPNPLKAIV